MYYRSQSFKLVFLFFLVLLFFVNQVNPQLVGPYDGDVPLTDTIEKYVETLKDEFSKSEFVSTYLYPKVLYQDSKITISRQVDIYNYERVTTHIGGYTRKLNITYYKVYFIVKNNHKLPLQVTFSTGKFSKYWYFLEVDNVSKNAAEQTYTWSLYILPNEEKRVAFGTPYYMDSELTVISALTLPESFVFTSSSSVKQNELIELELQDSRGSPLQNVEIIVLTPSNTAMRLTTDEKGKAKFKASEVGFYQYEVFGSKMDKRTEVLKVEVIDTSKKEDQNITVVN
ncbi:MAG: hypothetical protein N3E37_00005, partial [Candidatus Micrarchaeota archaeon]|nr:hypothetical protein [Candidatus Micrarchaeota archaeon]